MYEMPEQEGFRARMWLGLGGAGPIVLGVVFLTQSHGDVGIILLCIAVFIAGGASLVATGGGNYWRGISTRRKVVALPGLIIGCVAGVVLIAVATIALEAIKAEFGGRN